MKNIRIIAGKEFRGYLNSPMAYIVICIFLIVTGIFFSNYLKQINLHRYHNQRLFSICGSLAVIICGIITMRSLAEEKKMGTWELLLTSPVKDSEVVMGKFLAALGIMVVMLVLTLYYPLLLMIFGHPDMGPIWTSYLGLLLLGSSAVAVGIFVHR